MHKTALALLLGCFACGAAHAVDAESMPRNDAALSSSGGFLARITFTKGLQEFGFEAIPAAKAPHARDAQLSMAIASAMKKNFIETGIEASRQALIECQRETSVLLTMPSLRSDSQQAHCFRF